MSGNIYINQIPEFLAGDGLPERRRAGDHPGASTRLVSRMRGSVAKNGFIRPPEGHGLGLFLAADILIRPDAILRTTEA
jgi:hypothetical protein